MFFRLQCERIDVNTSDWDVGMALVGLNQVEVRSKALLESIVSIELELGTNNGVSSGVDGSETGVIGVITCGGDGTEISRSQVIGVGSRSGGQVDLADLGVGSILGNTRANSAVGGNLETSLAEVVEVLLVKVGSSDEGEDVGAILDVGEDQLRWIRKTGTVDAVITRIGIKVISVVVPLVVAQLDNIVSLDNPDKLLYWVIQVQLNLYVGVYC